MHVLLKNQMVNTVYVGYDPKEHTAYEVLKFSLERISTKPVRVIPLRRDILTKIGIYTRKHNSISGQDYDEIDGKPFSTQFSFSRFLIPALNMYEGLALYMDSDMYVRADISELFEMCKDKFQIIYNRPNSENITNDESPQKIWGDWSLAEKMGIPLMQTLQKEYNLDYNTTQMVLMSYCSHHISTQGGNSALAAYFGGENIIYGVKGYEVKHKSYETFFPKLSGQKIHHVQTYDELIKKVKNYVN